MMRCQIIAIVSFVKDVHVHLRRALTMGSHNALKTKAKLLNSSIIIYFCGLLVLSTLTNCENSDPDKDRGYQNYYNYRDQEGKSSGGVGDSGKIEVAQPLTYGAALQAEVQRLQSLQEVFPPSELSYYVPYGDRTILTLQFPTLTPQDLQPKRKPKPHEYGAKWQKSSKGRNINKDFGVVISQNYLYRENVRDYADFSKIFRNSRPSQDVLQQAGKLFAVTRKEKLASTNNENPGSGPESLYGDNESIDEPQNLNRKVANLLKSISHGKGWSKPKGTPSFALVAIESRVKVSGDSGSGVKELVHTNGSIIFPSPSSPEVLTFVPFILRQPGDVSFVFQGYENDMKGLLPQNKRELLRFLKLVEGIHDDSFNDGKERLGRVRRLSETITRPRLPITNLLADDPLEVAEDMARNTNWLYSSTVALRTLTHDSSHDSDKDLRYGPQPHSDYGASLYGPGEFDHPHHHKNHEHTEGQPSYGDLPPPADFYSTIY